MWARLSIVAGLLFGIVVAVVVFAGIVALSPGVPLPSVAAPSLPIASASPSPVASSATSPTGPGATFPLGPDSAGTAASTWDAGALPVHFWIDKDGIVRDGARGGIGPDITMTGLKSILPGVDDTP